MAQVRQAVVSVKSTSKTTMELEFPPNMRLHNSDFGNNWSVKRKGAGLRSFPNAGLVLRDLLKELHAHAEMIDKVSGDNSFVRILHQSDEGFPVRLLPALVRSCGKHDLRVCYLNPSIPPITVQPRYAV